MVCDVEEHAKQGDVTDTPEVVEKVVYPCLYQRYTFTTSHAHVTVLLSTPEQATLHKEILDPVGSTWNSASEWSELLETDPDLYTEMKLYVKHRCRPSQELAAESRLTKAFVAYLLQSPYGKRGAFYWSAWDNWKHLCSALQTDVELAKIAVRRCAWDVWQMPEKVRTDARLMKAIQQCSPYTYASLQRRYCRRTKTEAKSPSPPSKRSRM